MKYLTSIIYFTIISLERILAAILSIKFQTKFQNLYAWNFKGENTIT